MTNTHPNRNAKRCSTSLVTRETDTETMVRFCTNLVERQTPNAAAISNSCTGAGLRKVLARALGSGAASGKTAGPSCKQVPSSDPAGRLPKRKENVWQLCRPDWKQPEWPSAGAWMRG